VTVASRTGCYLKPAFLKNGSHHLPSAFQTATVIDRRYIWQKGEHTRPRVLSEKPSAPTGSRDARRSISLKRCLRIRMERVHSERYLKGHSVRRFWREKIIPGSFDRMSKKNSRPKIDAPFQTAEEILTADGHR